MRGVRVSSMYIPTGVKVLKECQCENIFGVIGPKLRSLHFDWSIGKTSTILSMVAAKCSNLVLFGIEFSTLTHEFRDVLRKNTQLQQLRLNECINLRPSYFNHNQYVNLFSIFLAGNKVVPKTIVAITKGCPNLRRLQIVSNYQMNDTAAQAIAANCREHLQALNLTGCNRISEPAMIAIFTACTALREVDVSSCDKLTDLSILAMTAHCKRMEKILIQKNTRYTDAALYAIADAFRNTLRVLYIGACENLSSLGITAVAQSCTVLSCLDIGAIPYIGTTALLAVSVRNLTELVLSFLTVTDAVLTSVGKNCRQLTILHMYYTQGFSVHGVYAVVTRCKALQELLVNADSDIVTPRAVQRFAMWNPQLIVVTENYLLGCGALD